MKRILMYLFAIILGAVIPIYFLLIWEPLKSEEVYSNNTIEKNENNYIDLNSSLEVENVVLNKTNNSNSIFNDLDKDYKDKLHIIMQKLSIIDYIKLNDLFSDKDDSEKIKTGTELVKKRLGISEYEEFKNILGNSIDISIID